MLKLILLRLVLAAFAVPIASQAFAFAVFVVPFGTPVTVGQTILLLPPVVPATLAQGIPLTWKKTSVPVTAAFAPNPPATLTNGTTTWNQNAISASSEWNAVGANISFATTAGAGNPCLTDNNVVAAFDATLCTGILPPIALGLTLLVAVVDSPTSFRIVDADIAMIPTNTLSIGGGQVSDAFDGPVVGSNFDFRRIMLHEFGHALGLAHPDTVFGNTAVTLNAIMHSNSHAAFRLSADDKNGALALYPPVVAGGGGGGGGGGGSGGFLLAVVLGALALMKWVYNRRRIPTLPKNRHETSVTG